MNCEDGAVETLVHCEKTDGACLAAHGTVVLGTNVSVLHLNAVKRSHVNVQSPLCSPFFVASVSGGITI